MSEVPETTPGFGDSLGELPVIFMSGFMAVTDYVKAYKEESAKEKFTCPKFRRDQEQVSKGPQNILDFSRTEFGQHKWNVDQRSSLKV